MTVIELKAMAALAIDKVLPLPLCLKWLHLFE